MTAPSYLSSDEKKIFRRFVKLLESENRASPSHVDALALLAQRLIEVQECNEIIERDGRTYETRSDRGGNLIIRAHPVVAQRSDAMRHAHSLLAELGLTPASAKRLLSEEEDEGDNPFTQFKR